MAFCSRLLAAAFVLGLAAGCSTVLDDYTSSSASISSTRGAQQGRGHVYLIRGLIGEVFSRGLDTLAEKIQRQGIPATVHSSYSVGALGEEVIQNYRREPGPIILIGHSLGADAVLVSADLPDWDSRVLELTGGRGVEHVVEAVGPATLARSIRSCAFDAEIALIGIFMGEAGFDGSAFAGRLVTVRRVAVGSRAAFETMNRAIALHQLRPVIDRVFPFAAGPAALKRLESGSHFGKVVMSM